MTWTLIAGGARRLGAEIARKLAKQRKNLVIQYKTSKTEVEKLLGELRDTGIKAEVLEGDFSTLQNMRDFSKRYLSRFPDTEAVVYNVGTLLLDSPLSADLESLQALFQTNVASVLLLIQQLVPSLKKQKGRIVTIGMVGCQEVRANTHAFSYNLSKTALWMVTKSLAKELAPHQVSANMVSPGYMEESVDLPQEIDKLPMGRLARFDEVARVVAFLLEPGSSYITGQNIEVAGGVRL